ncbi:MAG TPA: phosphoribosylformylglycinamidine cyclo-ligase [Chloroflexota bacterium]|nr:phosphoribosylformylglycinamidine cyclo-ligase [Chloroflexota bacterium]
MPAPGSRLPAPGSYAATGVDMDRANDSVALIRQAVARTMTPAVLSGVGGFGAMFQLAGYRQPVLVASTDGVGTKLKVAIDAGRLDSVGIDLVNHCVNDILTCGASPLFFLDYIGLGELVPDEVADIVRGMASACEATGSALIGGETAEMPGLYQPGDFDLVGFIVGAVERTEVIDGRRDIRPGDALLALPSSGLHTNGYSLVRRVFEGVPLDRFFPELGRTLAEELLEPHRCYLQDVRELRRQVQVRGLAHVTGGGLIDNLPRILPEGCGAAIQGGSWPVPPIFELLRQRVPQDECYRVFNMGVGMVVVVPPEDATKTGLPVIGQVIEGSGVTIR